MMSHRLRACVRLSSAAVGTGGYDGPRSTFHTMASHTIHHFCKSRGMNIALLLDWRTTKPTSVPARQRLEWQRLLRLEEPCAMDRVARYRVTGHHKIPRAFAFFLSCPGAILQASG